MEFFEAWWTALLAAFTAHDFGQIKELTEVFQIFALIILGFVVWKFKALSGLWRLIRRPKPIPAPRPFPVRPTREIVIGRDAMIAAIHESLADAQVGAIASPVVVTGGPGLGKTTVAREYVRRHGGAYRVEPLDAEDPVNLLSQIGAIFPGAEGTLQARADAALATIRADTGAAKPWLLVFDNAPSAEAVADLIPYAGHVKALITSRALNWPAARFTVYPARHLEAEDALELLLQVAGRAQDADTEAALLAEDLGWWPIGLVQAGEWLLVNPQVGFAEYRARLGELADEWLKSGTLEDDYPMTVAAAISLSLDLAVADKDTGPDELALLDLLPWLAPEGMDARLVLDIPNCALPNPKEMWDDIPQCYFDLADHPARVQAAISALARRSLAVVAGEGAERTVTLHRITAQILRARQAADAFAHRRAAAAVVAASYPAGVRGPVNHASWPACRRLNPHVATLATHVPDGDGDALRPHAFAALDFLLNQASIFHQQQASTDIALSHARMALRLKITRLGPDDPEVGAGQGNLGGALGAAGLWADAVTARREALRIAEAQGPDYPQLGTRLSNLAWALSGQAVADGMAGDARIARLREVEGLQRRAYKHYRRLPDAPDDGTASCLSNLAATYDALGDRRRARRIAALALATWREVLKKPGDPRLAYSLNNLGAMHLEDRAPDRALPMLEEALAIREAAFADNPRHPFRIGTAKWLATCRLALPTPDEPGARALCDQYDLKYDDIARDAAQFRP
ncbi:MAG: tetratricopeptide (TPR) repeat protein [Paracoccaceae bacterium]|jgi:tetratricopeptide (TPR) repeat protein